MNATSFASVSTGVDYLAAARAPRDSRRLPTGKRRYEIKDIQHRHREIIRLAMLGMKQVDIAKALGITPQNVSTVLNSQPIVNELAKLHEVADKNVVDVNAEVKAMIPKALETHREIMEERKQVEVDGKQLEIYAYDAPTRQRSADRVLDMAGHSRIQRVQGEIVHGYLSLNEIEAIKRRAASIIDVSPASSSTPSSFTSELKPTTTKNAASPQEG